MAIKDYLLGIALITNGFAQFSSKDEYLEPNPLSAVEESYVYDTTEYIIVNYRSGWSEAELICNGYPNGSFATLPTKKIAQFLGNVLAESDIEPEILWVGAKRNNPNESFVWSTGENVDSRLLITRGAENIKFVRNCLAITRVSHSTPLFVDMECHTKRPFLCSKPYTRSQSLGDMTTPDWIKIGEYQYGIFYDKVTFSTAVRECSKKNFAHLASFREYNEVKIVAKFMLIGRPSLESAWIGARYDAGNWKFLSSDLILDVRQDNATKFPPWRFGRSTKHSGCLSLDRHILTNAVFLESRCFKKQSYICTKAHDSLNFITSVIKKVGYVLYYNPKTWDQAATHCQSHKANLSIVNEQNIQDIIALMGENHTEVRHLWIGARLDSDGSNFYWYSTKAKLPDNNQGIKYYPPWYDTEFDKRFACLNMDRENHNFPIFYGADCNVAQPFICSQSDINALPRNQNITQDRLSGEGSETETQTETEEYEPQ